MPELLDEQQNEVHASLVKIKTFSTKEEAAAWEIPGHILGAVQHLPDGRYFRAWSPVGELGILTLREAGERLGLRVPLDGEYKVGKTWAQTH